MARFISPSGNPEIWDEKPAGYFTPEEWEAAHPPLPPDPEEHIKRRRQEIHDELIRNEQAALRALLADSAGAANDDDRAIIAWTVGRAEELREELAGLEGTGA